MDFDIDFALSIFWKVLGGAKITILITIVSLIIGMPLAFLIAMIRLKRIPVLDQIAKVYVSFIRGTPMIVQIYIIYYLVPDLLKSLFTGLDIKYNIYDLNPIIYAYIVFSLHTAASLSEVFRSALMTVDKGQNEAALASGLSTVQSYIRVVLPQALVVAIPNICTATVGLLKGTSLVFAMTVQDITAKARIFASDSYKYIEAYADILVIYIIICFITEKLFRLMEKRLSYFKTT